MQVGESVGNVVLLEHLNLNVADQLSSLWFFTHGLGFTRDPFMPPVHTITWINIGYQQLHLPFRHPSQVFGGVVGVIVPSIGKVLEWLEVAQDMLRGADKQGKLRWRWISLAASDHHLPFLTPKELNNKLTPSEQSQKRRTILEVVDPNGNVFHLHENYPTLDFRGGLGIAYLEVRCPIGSAKHIARWYRYFLKAIATVSKNPRFSKGRRTEPAGGEEEEEGTEGGRQYHAEEVELGYNGREAKIVVGPKQWLIFREAEEFTFDDGYHICVYISDFEQAYHRAAEQGLLYNEHRYADRARTLEEARHYHQFRIRDIVELLEETPSNGHANGHSTNGHENGGVANGHENGVGANGHSNGASNGNHHDERALPKEEKSVRRPKRVKSGRLLMRFEHEVRSLQHPLYMRPLVNRFGNVGIFCNQ